MRSHPMPEFGSFALLLALVLSAYTLVMGAVALWRSRSESGITAGGGGAGRLGETARTGRHRKLCGADFGGVCAGVGFVHE